MIESKQKGVLEMSNVLEFEACIYTGCSFHICTYNLIYYVPTALTKSLCGKRLRVKITILNIIFENLTVHQFVQQKTRVHFDEMKCYLIQQRSIIVVTDN